MTRVEARTAIKTATDHDGASDTQVSTTQLDTWIDEEHKLFRRQLSAAVPWLYTAVGNEETLAAGDDTLTIPNDFERLYRLERKYGENWYPVMVSDELNVHTGDLQVREEAGVLKLSPSSLYPGTYRIVYVAKPATLSADSGSGGTLLVPDGCEVVITERVCARVRERLNELEHVQFHLARAESVWREQRRALRKRYGVHAQPGMKPVRRW